MRRHNNSACEACYKLPAAIQRDGRRLRTIAPAYQEISIYFNILHANTMTTRNALQSAFDHLIVFMFHTVMSAIQV